jgi:hypothetical protein
MVMHVVRATFEQRDSIAQLAFTFTPASRNLDIPDEAVINML